jgi:dihydrofolate synthase / folylpolyglutamate synthase
VNSRILLERLKALHPQSIDLSLDRIKRLLADLGNPDRRLPPIVHVAGTNGKGSSIAFLRAIAEAIGKRVQSYTSPHLIDFHERILLPGPNGSVPITERALVEAVSEQISLSRDVVFHSLQRCKIPSAISTVRP